MKQVGYRKTCLFDIENLDQNRPQKSAQISNLTGRPCGSCILLTVPPCHHPALSTYSTQFMDYLGWCIQIRLKRFLLCFTFVCQVWGCIQSSCVKNLNGTLSNRPLVPIVTEFETLIQRPFGLLEFTAPFCLCSCPPDCSSKAFWIPFHVPLPSASSKLLVLPCFSSVHALKSSCQRLFISATKAMPVTFSCDSNSSMPLSEHRSTRVKCQFSFTRMYHRCLKLSVPEHMGTPSYFAVLPVFPVPLEWHHCLWCHQSGTHWVLLSAPLPCSFFLSSHQVFGMSLALFFLTAFINIFFTFLGFL